MSLFEIKQRWSGAVLFSLETDSFKLCLEAAVKARANLARANLARANLAEANLAGANLAEANLAGANLAEANLAGANFAEANFAEANLAGANLAGANLARANLAEAKNAELAISKTRILPEGDLIGWKKCNNGVIVKLRIPADAKRSHAFGRKCRAEYAIDLGHWDAKGNALPPEHEAFTNAHGPKTIYVCGQTIKADSWDENWQNECSHGIHFWITKEEAIAY